MADELPKLRLQLPETAEQLARRHEKEKRAASLQREDELAGSLAPFRVGSVPYLNAVPLTRGLEDQVIFATPAKLAEMLQRGELDAALVSVTEILFNDRYDVLDGIAVASLGEVQSVFLAHRRPLAEAREIFCDTASLTSIALLRVLLAEKGLQPEFKPLASYDRAALPEFVLLIGDPALDLLRASPAHQIWDLGTAWTELTQLPFVYAVWALRRHAGGSIQKSSGRRGAGFRATGPSPKTAGRCTSNSAPPGRSPDDRVDVRWFATLRNSVATGARPGAPPRRIPPLRRARNRKPPPKFRPGGGGRSHSRRAC